MKTPATPVACLHAAYRLVMITSELSFSDPLTFSGFTALGFLLALLLLELPAERLGMASDPAAADRPKQVIVGLS